MWTSLEEEHVSKNKEVTQSVRYTHQLKYQCLIKIFGNKNLTNVSIVWDSVVTCKYPLGVHSDFTTFLIIVCVSPTITNPMPWLWGQVL